MKHYEMLAKEMREKGSLIGYTESSLIAQELGFIQGYKAAMEELNTKASRNALETTSSFCTSSFCTCEFCSEDAYNDKILDSTSPKNIYDYLNREAE